MRAVFWTAFLFSAGVLLADDSLRLPPSAAPDQVRTFKDRVEVKWPYGTVTMPVPAAPNTPLPKSPTHPRAWNRGVFNLRYELVREEGFYRARHVHITVENKTSFDTQDSSALKAHEEMHRRINSTEARRMEKSLSAFQYKTSGDRADLKRADALFREEFHKRVAEVDQLHKEWDKNQIP